MGKRWVLAIIAMLISFIYFVYGIHYVTYNDKYLFRYEKMGDKLIVDSGIDHIGEKIDITKRNIQIKDEIINYSYTRQQDTDIFKFEKSDGTRLQVEGNAKDLVRFVSTSEIQCDGASGDNGASDDISFLSAIMMSYIVLRNLFSKLFVYCVIELLLIVIGIWLCTHKETVSKLHKRIFGVHSVQTSNWGMLIPVIGAWLIHFLN